MLGIIVAGEAGIFGGLVESVGKHPLGEIGLRLLGIVRHGRCRQSGQGGACRYAAENRELTASKPSFAVLGNIIGRCGQAARS